MISSLNDLHDGHCCCCNKDEITIDVASLNVSLGSATLARPILFNVNATILYFGKLFLILI